VKKLFGFVSESRDELKKVSWPKKDDVYKYTVVTVITLFVFGLFLWVVDSALFKIVKVVTQ
jgi:preprotein translocase subunit SecE